MSGEIGAGDLTLSIITLGRPHELHKTLVAVGELPNIQVILNGADAGEYRWVMERHPRVRFIENPVNRGVAAAWNQGIIISNTRFVVLSGDDLAYDQGWEERLLEELNSQTGALQFSLSEPTPLSAFCVDKRIIVQQGWFDHNFSRIYYEDEDWYLRTQERMGLYNRDLTWDDLVPRLNVVHRHPHQRAYWNSIPNRVYFWRKWQRLSAPEAQALFLRPNIIVKRRLKEPVWPHLEPLCAAYARGEYGAGPFLYDEPALPIRLLTRATTNHFFIFSRKLVQRFTNPHEELK